MSELQDKLNGNTDKIDSLNKELETVKTNLAKNGKDDSANNQKFNDGLLAAEDKITAEKDDISKIQKV